MGSAENQRKKKKMMRMGKATWEKHSEDEWSNPSCDVRLDGVRYE